MQITNTFTCRNFLLNELGTLNDSRQLTYSLKWQRYEDAGKTSCDIGYQLLDHIAEYLSDLIEIKWMLYEILIAVAADS